LISRAEAGRRVREAVDLGRQHGLGGEPLLPVLEGTATPQRDGSLGGGQVAVIRRFWHQLSGCVDEADRRRAEAELAVGVGKPGSTQRVAGLDHCHHHAR
jgi:Domain of unknown function (DUF222)